jgi:hypothetical protein
MIADIAHARTVLVEIARLENDILQRIRGFFIPSARASRLYSCLIAGQAPCGPVDAFAYLGKGTT